MQEPCVQDPLTLCDSGVYSLLLSSFRNQIKQVLSLTSRS